ncbi:hypothetical protein BX666DRAFT_1912120 [Dichotomocladium elegans]|nr:hypothetical protein BX666DRAFT_1912120 [Dichotomocladium elegans]
MTGHTENNLAIINESEESSGNISSSSSDAEINGIDRRIIYQQRPVSKIQLTRHSCVNGSQSRSRRSSLSNETSQPLQDASLHGFLLGSTLGAGLASAYFASRPHLGLFFAAAALFHYLDGLVIALVFSGDSKPSTFFILGSRTAPPIGYMRHHVFALVEFVSFLWWPDRL